MKIYIEYRSGDFSKPAKSMVATEVKVEDTSTQMHDWFEENNESKEEPPAVEVEVPHRSISFPRFPWGEASASRFSHHLLFRRKATPRNCRRRKPFANSATRRRSSRVTAPWQLDVSCDGNGPGRPTNGVTKTAPRAFTQHVLLSDGLSMHFSGASHSPSWTIPRGISSKARSTQISIAVTPSTWAAWPGWKDGRMLPLKRYVEMLAVIKWWLELSEHGGMSLFFEQKSFGTLTWIGMVCRHSKYWIHYPLPANDSHLRRRAFAWSFFVLTRELLREELNMGLWGTWTCSATMLESTGIAYWNGSREFQHFSKGQKGVQQKIAKDWSVVVLVGFCCRCCWWHVIFCSQQPSSTNEFHQLKLQQDFLVRTAKNSEKVPNLSKSSSQKLLGDPGEFFTWRFSLISCQVMAQEDLVDYSDEEVPRTLEVVSTNR